MWSYLLRPTEIPVRFAVWHLKQRLRESLGLNKPRFGEKLVAGASFSRAKYWKERDDSAFFSGVAEVRQTRGAAVNDWKPWILENGAASKKHVFRYGGVGKVELGDRIEWCQDPFLRRRNDTRASMHPDLRIIWELNRCSQLPVLALAGVVAGDDVCYQEVIRQMRQWEQSNPMFEGQNWQSSMEASIRIVNWVWAFHLIKNSRHCDDIFISRFLTQVWAHGEYIYLNLERSVVNNNHFLAGGIGLLHLGVLFPEIPGSERWRRAGVKILFSEVLNQTYPDGPSIEGSIPYHGFALEMVLPAILLCERAGISVPLKVMERIERMLNFVAAYTRSDGSYPNFGDRDDGHLLRVACRTEDSHRHLLVIGAVIYSRADFKRIAPSWDLEAQLLLGDVGRRSFEALRPPVEPDTSHEFRNAGYFFMRYKKAHMAIDCADVGLRGRGGHGHNDCLSFELHAGGQPLLIDSGSFQYAVPEAVRRFFQSTKSHNTAEVDRQEIARFVPGNAWGISDEANPTVRFWYDGAGYAVFEGSHDGYRRLSDPVGHIRRIIFNKRERYWILEDRFLGAEWHRFDIYFHLAPNFINFASVLGEHKAVCTTKPFGPNIVLLLLPSQDASIVIEEVSISQCYGHLEPAPRVRVSTETDAPCCVRTLLALVPCPAKGLNYDSLSRQALRDLDYWNKRNSRCSD